ncbi:T9SS type A sorting domain-containing protein [Thalassobellus sediminis]|uniref:T9SS type A sorting domain-containing protein n=1 Tax=Thalassobellus sediminis TaxID=3367753 RepID=UPI00378CCBD0
MKLTNLFFISSLFSFIVSNSQSLVKQTLAIQGDSHAVYFNNKSFYLIESIGQTSVINTFNANSHIVRQGFLQPVSASVFFSDSKASLKATVFPNPFLNQVQIKFKEPIIDVLNLALYDVIGRVVIRQEYNPIQSIPLDLTNLSNGSYFLKIKMRSKVLSAKIIKR